MGQKGEDYNIWLEGFDRSTYPKLDQSMSVDVTVVGGGITGVVTAYFLAKSGRSVALVDKGRLGEWTTDCTTGFLTQVIDTSYQDLIKIFGLDKARLIAQSKREAIDLIKEISEAENIESDFQIRSNYIFSKKEKDLAWLKREGEALTKVGVKASYHQNNNLPFSNLGCVEVLDQATYQPMKFLTALAERAQNLGAKIFEQTEVQKISGRKNNYQVVTSSAVITSRDVVVATYSPVFEPWKLYFKKAMYRSYVLELTLPAGSLPIGLYEDSERPYHYFKVDEIGDETRIIFGGEDHRDDLPIAREKNYRALEKHARQILAGFDFQIKRRWSGQILESVDGLPYIGEDCWSGIFYAFGFSGNGLTYSIIAGRLLTDLINKTSGPFLRYSFIYRINRWPRLRAGWVKGRDYFEILLGGWLKNIFVKK